MAEPVLTKRIRTEIKRLRLDEVLTLDQVGEKNARYMKHETYQRLVENLKRDGELTSVPFAWLDPDQGSYVVLSGNHRTRAARDAGIQDADFKTTDDALTRAERRAIQLSHNAIEGEDDPATLKEIYAEIDDVELRLYSALDDKTLDLMDDVQVSGLTEANLDFQTISVTFLPDEAERAATVLEQAHEAAMGDEHWIARYRDYDRWQDAVDASAHAHKVTNVATAVGIVLDVFENNIEQLQDGFLDEDGDPLHGGTVPLSTIFGTDQVPADVAAVLTRAVTKMRDAGDITSNALWRAIELWAADYMGGE